MKAQKVRMSTHATEDRLDRLTYIAMTIGFGDTAYTFPDTSHADRYFAFTTTGVMIVKSVRSDVIVTAYIPTIDKVYAIFKSAGAEMPNAYKRIIVKNEKHNRMQDIVKF
jgi:hypothetical protein